MYKQNRSRGSKSQQQWMISDWVPLPDRPPGWKGGLFCPAGLLNAEALPMLPFLGADADLEYVFAAGDVCTVVGLLSTASLGNKYTFLYKSQHYNIHTQRHIFQSHSSDSNKFSYNLWQNAEWDRNLRMGLTFTKQLVWISVTHASNQDNYGAFSNKDMHCCLLSICFFKCWHKNMRKQFGGGCHSIYFTCSSLSDNFWRWSVV